VTAPLSNPLGSKRQKSVDLKPAEVVTARFLSSHSPHLSLSFLIPSLLSFSCLSLQKPILQPTKPKEDEKKPTTTTAKGNTAKQPQGKKVVITGLKPAPKEKPKEPEKEEEEEDSVPPPVITVEQLVREGMLDRRLLLLLRPPHSRTPELVGSVWFSPSPFCWFFFPSGPSADICDLFFSFFSLSAFALFRCSD
jgi:hypothetical protein